jgi:hypothetical protein
MYLCFAWVINSASFEENSSHEMILMCARRHYWMKAYSSICWRWYQHTIKQWCYSLYLSWIQASKSQMKYNPMIKIMSNDIDIWCTTVSYAISMHCSLICVLWLCYNYSSRIILTRISLNENMTRYRMMILAIVRLN